MYYDAMRNEIRRLHNVFRVHRAEMEEMRSELEKLRQENKDLRDKLGLSEEEKRND